jgi:hypothetical protein
MHVEGVAQTFGDELTLLGALQLRWHTRLAALIEREASEPVDLPAAVVTAWTQAAQEMPGLRAVLDRCADQPSSTEMARMLAKASAKDWAMMAAMAGQAAPADPNAPEVGRALERRARKAYRPAPSGPVGRRRAQTPPRSSLLRRVKSVLAA